MFGRVPVLTCRSPVGGATLSAATPTRTPARGRRSCDGGKGAAPSGTPAPGTRCLECWHTPGRQGRTRGERSKGDTDSHDGFPGPLWTRPHPFHGLRRLLLDPEDEVRRVFGDADGGRLELVAALLQERPHHSDTLGVIIGGVGLQPAAGGCGQCCAVNMGALLTGCFKMLQHQKSSFSFVSNLPLFYVV